MIAAWWARLGDDELLARLVQRGVHIEIARRLVAARDRDQAARTRIDETLRR